MVNKKQILIMFVFLFLFVTPLISAWGPHTHNYIADSLKERKSENQVLSMCLDGGTNEKAFRAGLMIPDITVMYYYSEGGKNYKATHNWLFQQELMNEATTEDERCFAYGVASHLIQDSIAHTDAVPKKIENTRIPNWLLHPLLEKKYDSELVNEHPELMDETNTMLSAMYGNKGDRYVQMIENTLGDNININVQKEVDNLAHAIGSFYDDAFAPREQENTLFAVYTYIDKFTNFIQPIVGKWNVGDMDSYMDKNIDVTISTFNNWGARHALSPHGFSELTKADEKASFIVPLFLISLLIFFIALPFYLMYKTKKFRYIYLTLLIIPAILLAILIIYAIL